MPTKAPRAPVTLAARSGVVLRQSISLGIVVGHARTKSDPVCAFVGPRQPRLAGLTNAIDKKAFAFRIDFENGDCATGLTYNWRAIIDWLAKGARRKNGAFKRVVLNPETPAEMVERYLDRRGPAEIGEKL